METKTYSLDGIKSIFAFPFEDNRWKNKLLLGFVFMFAGIVIPIVPFLYLYGYCYQLIHNIVVDKKNPALPDWDDWGGLFKKGFRLFAAGFIASLPMIIIMIVSFTLFLIPLMQMEDATAVDPEVMTIGMMGWSMIFPIIVMFVSLILQAFFPVAAIHVIRKDDFKAIFQIREWWGIFRNNIVGFLIAMILVYGSMMLLMTAMQIMMFTLVLCIAVPILGPAAGVYLIIIGSAIYAQAYREAEEVVGTELEPIPDPA